MERATLANPAIAPARILKVAASLGFLGTGAGSGPRMMAILCEPQVCEREVAELIKREPAICARVLRVANSPYYGQTRVISSIDRALLVLGLDAVRGIAAAACLSQTMISGIPAGSLDMSALLTHSLATASAAETLARKASDSLASEAFIAGLLHNLGVILQAQLDASGFQAMTRARTSADSREIRALEEQYAAVGHEECIAVVLQAWQLPDALVDAVRHHHEPMAAPVAHRGLAALVSLGAHIALARDYTCPLDCAPGEWSAAALAQLQLAVEDVEGVAAELPERVAPLRGAFSAV